MAAINRGRRSLSSKVIKPAKALLDAEASDHEEDQELASPEMLAEFALANPDAAIGLEKEAIPSAAGALTPSLDLPTIEGGADDGTGTGQVVGAPDLTPSLTKVSIKQRLSASPAQQIFCLHCMHCLPIPGRFKQPVWLRTVCD
jgi:hypothetical protein